MQYLWNFNLPLGLCGHLRWCFWHRHRATSSKNDGASPWQLLLLSTTEHQSPSSPFRGIPTILLLHQFSLRAHFQVSININKYIIESEAQYIIESDCMFISPSILRNTILHNTNTYHQTYSNEEAEVDICNLRRKILLKGHAGILVARKVNVFCVCFMRVCGMILIYVILFTFILFYKQAQWQCMQFCHNRIHRCYTTKQINFF